MSSLRVVACGTVVTTSLSNLPSRTLASDVQPVHMELLTSDGRRVDGPQQLGASLQLRYTLNGGDGKCHSRPTIWHKFHLLYFQIRFQPETNKMLGISKVRPILDRSVMAHKRRCEKTTSLSG